MRTLYLCSGLLGSLLASPSVLASPNDIKSPIVARPIDDSAVGVIYLYQGGTQPVWGPGTVTQWSFFDNDAGSAGAKVTPLILEVTGATQWTVVAIGTSRASGSNGVQTHPFGAIAGSATLQAGKRYTIGFTHRGYTGTWPNLVPDAGSPGVVDFTGYNDFSDKWSYAIGVASLGTVLGTGGLVLDGFGLGGRIYSCVFAVDGNLPLSYCTAGTSTNGCVPSISPSGSPSVSASSGFTIHVSNVEGGKQGLVFYGISGRNASAWGSGSTSFLCVKSPTQRMTLASSGGTSGQCNGALSIDWLAYLSANPFALGAPFSGGVTVGAQAWYRDPPAVKTTNLSNALEFVTVP